MRQIQPYEQGLPTRQQGLSLQAMLAGRTAFGANPADEKRQADVLLKFMLSRPSAHTPTFRK